MLSYPSCINADAIAMLPHVECNVLLDEFPNVMETRKAVQHLSSVKVPGEDANDTTLQRDVFCHVYGCILGSCFYSNFLIRCRFDNKLFKLMRLQANAQTCIFVEFLYANDMDKNVS